MVSSFGITVYFRENDLLTTFLKEEGGLEVPLLVLFL